MTNECPYDPASNSLEERIFQIWKDILNMPDGRQDATFFELQGQSISAVRIAGRIEDELGIAI
ncbi:MAG: phosphopantetheine-binding protein, partial [Jatrophihabitantaceae bacterium]